MVGTEVEKDCRFPIRKATIFLYASTLFVITYKFQNLRLPAMFDHIDSYLQN